MRTINHLESLTKKIQAHCPELMELSPGCKLNWNGLYAWLAGFELARYEWRIYNTSNNIIPTELRIEDVEILGHPIQLSHVLRALSDDIAIRGEDGMFLEKKYNEEGEYLWWLERDIYFALDKPLESQSSEVIQFLDDNISLPQ